MLLARNDQRKISVIKYFIKDRFRNIICNKHNTKKLTIVKRSEKVIYLKKQLIFNFIQQFNSNVTVRKQVQLFVTSKHKNIQKSFIFIS